MSSLFHPRLHPNAFAKAQINSIEWGLRRRLPDWTERRRQLSW